MTLPSLAPTSYVHPAKMGKLLLKLAVKNYGFGKGIKGLKAPKHGKSVQRHAGKSSTMKGKK